MPDDLETLQQSVGVPVPVAAEHMVSPLVELAYNNQSRALTEHVIRLAIQVGYYAAGKEALPGTYAARTRSTEPPQTSWKGFS